jgi:hypothetical protein
MELDVAVTSPDAWAPQQDTLVSALAFLTTDSWNLGFVEGTIPFSPPKKTIVTDCDSVALLSGGLDSLVGGIDLVGDGKKPYFVSQTVRGDANQQSMYASQLGNRPHVQLNHNAKTDGKQEASQRARSLTFIAYGVLVVSTLQAHRDGQRVDLYVNENGFISINPPLTPMRVGSLSTRTAHPRFLGLLQQVLDGVGLNVRIVNPYQIMTKGEMLVASSDQDLLRELATTSTSCGRYQRYNYTHCGRCLPCQVRRAAFLRWGQTDGTGYFYEDLGRRDKDHAGFDDVRSVAMARLTAADDGFDNWLGSSLCGVPSSERADTRAMLERGLDELGALHDYYNVT